MEPSSTALIVTCNIATTTKNYNILPRTTTDPIHTHTHKKKEQSKPTKNQHRKNIRNSLRFQSQHSPTKAGFWSWSDQSPIKTVSYLNPPARSRDSLGFRTWMPLATPSGLQQSARGDWNWPSLCLWDNGEKQTPQHRQQINEGRVDTTQRETPRHFWMAYAATIFS